MSLDTAEVWMARTGAAETKDCSEGLAIRALLTGRRYICDRGASCIAKQLNHISELYRRIKLYKPSAVIKVGHQLIFNYGVKVIVLGTIDCKANLQCNHI